MGLVLVFSLLFLGVEHEALVSGSDWSLHRIVGVRDRAGIRRLQVMGDALMGAGAKRDYNECPPSRVEKYKAKHKPHCNGGFGCNRCWDKWYKVNGFPQEAASGSRA